MGLIARFDDTLWAVRSFTTSTSSPPIAPEKSGAVVSCQSVDASDCMGNQSRVKDYVKMASPFVGFVYLICAICENCGLPYDVCRRVVPCHSTETTNLM